MAQKEPQQQSLMCHDDRHVLPSDPTTPQPRLLLPTKAGVTPSLGREAATDGHPVRNIWSTNAAAAAAVLHTTNYGLKASSTHQYMCRGRRTTSFLRMLSNRRHMQSPRELPLGRLSRSADQK